MTYKLPLQVYNAITTGVRPGNFTPAKGQDTQGQLALTSSSLFTGNDLYCIPVLTCVSSMPRETVYSLGGLRNSEHKPSTPVHAAALLPRLPQLSPGVPILSILYSLSVVCII